VDAFTKASIAHAALFARVDGDPIGLPINPPTVTNEATFMRFGSVNYDGNSDCEWTGLLVVIGWLVLD